MKPRSILTQGLCLLLLLACMPCASASTFFWGSNFNDNLFDSKGNVLDSTYSFEIGTFGSFVPTYQNVNQWTSNWKVIDRAFDPDVNGWNTIDQFFAGTVEINDTGKSNSPDSNPSDVFTEGEIVYLWAYNSKDIVPSSEWALLTDGATAAYSGAPWVVPVLANTQGSYNWNLSDASTAIIGGANNVQGPGAYTATPGVFSLQTAVVPEPGSVLLLLSAAASHLIRRARRLNLKHS